MAPSKLAEAIRGETIAAMAAMTPGARLQLAFELGRRGVEMYMSAYDIDYAAAARTLKQAGRAGRRSSRCMDDDAP